MGYRFVGVSADPNTGDGGSTYDLLTDPGPLAYPDPTTFFPVTTAAVDAGYEDRDRNDEVRGIRSTAAPYPWRAAPSFTFSCRLYPGIAKWVFPRLINGTGTPTGTAPAAITTAFEPVGHGAILPASLVTLVRDDQIDYLWGVWVESAELTVSAENEVTVQVTGRALYHETVPLGSTEFEPDTAAFLDPYSGMTLAVRSGELPTPTAIDCVSSWGFTFTNSLSDDDDVRYCKGKNVVRELVGDRYRYRHYPDRHKVGRQQITGNLGFGSVQPTFEDRRLLTTAEAMVATLTGNPAGTDPAADELVRFTFADYVLTGGGPDDLAEDGELKSAYEWSAHLNPTTGKDFTVEFVADAAVTV